MTKKSLAEIPSENLKLTLKNTVGGFVCSRRCLRGDADEVDEVVECLVKS
ncbi:MAG: hypothetical protein RLZZ245_3806 [Verrucomicrobiota bacterium]